MRSPEPRCGSSLPLQGSDMRHDSAKEVARKLLNGLDLKSRLEQFRQHLSFKRSLNEKQEKSKLKVKTR